MAGGALLELLARIGAAPGRSLALTADELQQWPADAVAALKSNAVLRPGKPGDTAVCPGCEQACVMLVQQRVRSARPETAFVVCDRRDDIGRVAVPPAALERWQASGALLADALARLLGGESAFPEPGSAGSFRLGVIKGGKGTGTVLLQWGAQGPNFLAGGHELALQHLLTVKASRLVLDVRRLARCIDSPASGVTLSEETPDERKVRLEGLVAAERKKNPRKFLQAAADRAGMTVYALKQVVYRKREGVDLPERRHDAWQQPVLTRTKSRY